MRGLPAISAVLFGIAASAFALTFFPGAGFDDGAWLIAGLGISLALLGGGMGGRYLRRSGPDAGWVRHGLVGAAVPVAVGVTGGILFILFAWIYGFVEGIRHGLGDEPLHLLSTVEALFGFAGYGAFFGLIASPFGIAAGLALRVVAPRLAVNIKPDSLPVVLRAGEVE